MSSADLNTELIRVFLEGGIDKLEEISEEAASLPPPPVRRRVGDDELLEIIRENHAGKTGMGLVRFLRDTLGISASVERIGAARRILISAENDDTGRPTIRDDN